MSSLKFTVSAFALVALSATAASARDQLQIAGSSTVLPFSTIVAEAFGEQGTFKTPVVEGGGSGAGRAAMCKGLGEATIDIANSSSAIKQSDIDTCAENGVTEIMEIRIGYDGIVFASDIAGPDFALNSTAVFAAVAPKIAKTALWLITQPRHGPMRMRPCLPKKSWRWFPAPNTARAKCSTSS
jgi:phosphate transport system substrate-binding protein